MEFPIITKSKIFEQMSIEDLNPTEVGETAKLYFGNEPVNGFKDYLNYNAGHLLQNALIYRKGENTEAAAQAAMILVTQNKALTFDVTDNCLLCDYDSATIGAAFIDAYIWYRPADLIMMADKVISHYSNQAENEIEMCNEQLYKLITVFNSIKFFLKDISCAITESMAA
jgi:hypothetical protein